MSQARLVLAALTLSAAGLLGIVGWESYRAVPYRDSGGIWTDGFGNTKDVDPKKPVTVEKALQQAERNAAATEGAVKRCVKVPLAQYELDAYVSLAYNIGTTAFCNSTLTRKLNAGDYAGACREITHAKNKRGEEVGFTYAGGKRMRGLIKRRAAERATCEGRG